MFYIIITIQFLVVLLLVLPSLLNKRGILIDNPEKQNALIARQRIEEARSQYDNSNIDPPLEDIEQEVQSTLVDDIKVQQIDVNKKVTPKLSLVILGLLPILSFLVYNHTGSSQLISSEGLTAASTEATDSAHDINFLLEQLEVRIQQEPDNPEGWELAARTYMNLGNYEKAALAYAQLNKLIPGNPDLLSSWADSLIMSNSNTYTRDAERATMQALNINPNHINALWIAALGSASKGEYEEAITYLQTLRKQVPSNEELISNIDSLIQENQSRVSGNSTPATELSNAENSLDSKKINVKVELSATVLENIDEFKTVFIIARAKNGPPAPLAVSSHSPLTLPNQVTLTREMSMIPGLDIEAFDEIELLARISKSGNPIPQNGDYESETFLVTSENIDNLFLLRIERLIEADL